MHSGTTLFHKMVTRHPKVLSAVKESKILEFSSYHQKRYRLSNYSVEYLLKLGRLEVSDLEKNKICNLKKEVVHDYFMVLFTISCQRNFTHIIDGSPKSFLFLSKIQRIPFKTKLVLITRDPRDILASIKKRRQNVTRSKYPKFSMYLKKTIQYGYSVILHSYSIRNTFKRILALDNSNSIETIKIDYYDITVNYNHTAREVCNFLGLPFEYFPLSSEMSISNSAYSITDKGGVTYISNYEKILSRLEVKALEFIFKDYFERNSFYKPAKIGILNYIAFLLFVIKVPYDFIIHVVKRALRFNSFEQFVGYVQTRIKIMKK